MSKFLLKISYLFFPLLGLCVKAEPATLFTTLLVPLLLKSFAALLATRLDVLSFLPILFNTSIKNIIRIQISSQFLPYTVTQSLTVVATLIILQA
jgi:hypothetical protein